MTDLWSKLTLALQKKQGKPIQKIKLSFLLCLCVIMGLALNLWGVNFGLPFFRHPDESHYLPRALRILYTSDPNPNYFYNPPLLTYLYSIVLSLYYFLGKLVGWFDSMKDFETLYLSNPTSFFLIARATNALLSTGICLLLYRIGKNMFNKITGVIASILVCSVFLIVKDSHYAVNDITGTFFLILSFNYIIDVYRKGRRKDYVLSGLFAGIAVATKYNMGIVIFPLVLAHIFFNRKIVINKKFMWTVFSCFIGFILFCPWIILDYRKFLTDFVNQSMMSTDIWFGGSTLPAYGQYIFTLIWGYGFLPFCFSVMGSIHLWREKEIQKLLLIACFPLSYYLLLGGMKLFYIRFAIPIIPYLCLLSACGIIFLVRRFSCTYQTVILIFLTLASISQGLVFSCKHNLLISKTDTRILARNWIANNLPPQSKIVTEGYSPSLKIYNDKDRLMENINNHQVKSVWTALPRVSLNEYKRLKFKYIITSSYISKRYLDNPDKYPRENSFYRTLEREAKQIFKISPAKGEVPFYLDEVYSPFWNLFILERPGPTITIFQID